MAALTTPNESAELMSSKPRCRHRPRRSDFPKRLRLGIYLDHPRRFPPSEVIGYNKSAVYVWDRHPKSTVHALLLPRDKSKRLMSPWEALKDKEFLAEMQAEAAKLKTLVAMELKSRFKDVSETDKLRAQYEKTVAAGEAYVGDVPVARNWEDEVKIGFHSVQTMKHLHFHVLSRDCIARTGPTHPGYYSERHYNSFNTSFFVELDVPSKLAGNSDAEIKKSESDAQSRALSAVDGRFKCWACKKLVPEREGLSKNFEGLGIHLKQEFEKWKRL